MNTERDRPEKMPRDDAAGGNCGCKGRWGRWILAALAVATVAALLTRGSRPGGPPCCGAGVCAMPQAAATSPAPAAAQAARPRLVDVGAKSCIPCKMMAPILEELEKTCAAELEVLFVDVREHPEAAAHYGIRMIPTQILYDAAGRELFRHEGFFSREEILAAFRERGITLGATNAVPAG